MTADPHLALALELADIADAITMSRFRADDLVVETKPDLTPVTEADRTVEAALRERVAAEPGDHAVLGEEFGDDGDAELRWIVDPIDGTKGYVRGLPIWATLIGLERAGRLELGVASAPALGSRWWGSTAVGAFRDGQPMRVSAVGRLADAGVSLAWDHDELDGDFGTRARRLAGRCWRTRSLGDFWHHMLVAEGALDIAVEPKVAIWDVAAVQPIVEAAGGRFTDLAGVARPDGGSAVTTNGLLHDEVIEAFGR